MKILFIVYYVVLHGIILIAIIVRIYLVAGLHDQNKSGFWRAGFYLAKQSNLKSNQKALISWKKADPPKNPLLFWSCKQANSLGKEGKGRPCSLPWIFTHDTANVCTTITRFAKTPTKHGSSLLRWLTLIGVIKDKWGPAGHKVFLHENLQRFSKSRHFSGNGCFSKKVFKLFTFNARPLMQGNLEMRHSAPPNPPLLRREGFFYALLGLGIFIGPLKFFLTAP